MDVKITPNKLSGKVRAVSSKSYAHRLYIAAALAQLTEPDSPPAKIIVNNESEDMAATTACLGQLRFHHPEFNCGESGSTLRFMLPIAMALHDKAVFFGKGRLPQRPMSPLKEELEAHGCQFEISGKSAPADFTEIFTVSGKLQPGDFQLPGDVSSQYVTGLLFALPLLEKQSRIIITSPLESKSYVEMTLSVLLKFGINIKLGSYNNPGFREPLPVAIIDGNQTYKLPSDEVFAEGDWSNAAFWLVAGALKAPGFVSSVNSEILCTGLNTRSLQGDQAIVDIIRNFGGIVSYTASGVYVTEGMLNGSDINAAEIPDLVPVLAVLAAASEGTSHITNAGRLRIKESDRLASITDCLSTLGARIKEHPDGLTINGRMRLEGGIVDSHNDHRIAMAAAIASIYCKAPVTITNAQAVNKSYPTFFEDFASLGGIVDVF